VCSRPRPSRCIATVRGQPVILDSDLAALYDVPTKRFNEAVRRNGGKFSADFMFQLSAEEWAALRSQFATLDAAPAGRGQHRNCPVLSPSTARSWRPTCSAARARSRSWCTWCAPSYACASVASTHRDVAQRLNELEQKTEGLALAHDNFSRNTRAQLKQVFDALRELMAPSDPPRGVNDFRLGRTHQPLAAIGQPLCGGSGQSGLVCEFTDPARSCRSPPSASGN